MGRLIALTAISKNGNERFDKPRVVYLNEDLIKVVPGGSGDPTKVIEETAYGQKDTYMVYEKAMQIEAARNPAATDLYLKKLVYAALAGAGTTQGGGTALAATGYFFEALTIGAGATEAFTLPAATVGKVVVIINNDTANDAAKVFPAVGEFFEGQPVNTVYSIAGGARKHLVCLTAGYWTVADDYGV